MCTLGITTTNYPGFYNNNEDKQWTIEAPDGQIITFEFSDFSIESHQNCVWDWVQVIDGNGQELLKKSCGNEKPENFFSKSNNQVSL